MIFLHPFEFERRIKDLNLQVDALVEPSVKTKARNSAAKENLFEILKFMEQLDIPFGGHRDSSCLKPVSDIKNINTSAVNFRAILQFHSIGIVKLAVHLKESPSDATCFSPDNLNWFSIALCNTKKKLKDKTS